MKVINRLLLVITFTTEFVDWLKSKDKAFDFNVEELNKEPCYFLIREPVSDDDYQNIIEANFGSIFTTILEPMTNMHLNVTKDEFDRFIEIGVCEMVHDISHGDVELGYEDF